MTTVLLLFDAENFFNNLYELFIDRATILFKKIIFDILKSHVFSSFRFKFYGGKVLELYAWLHYSVA